jgi:hypothetical protein
MDATAFRRRFRHVSTPVEVVVHGRLIGIWFPMAPLAGPEPSHEAGGYSGNFRAPKRGTAAAVRLAPLIGVLDAAEAEHRELERAHRRWVREYGG